MNVTAALLIEQLDHHWTTQLRPRLDGLTDDEYRWEPVDGCWNVRPRSQAATSHAAGGGDVVMDFALPEPDPSPVTTIAWRLGHISVGIFAMRTAAHFDGPELSYFSADWPLTAAGGLALLDEQYDAWISNVAQLDDAALRAPCGPAEGPFADRPFAVLVLHLNREAIHHGAEVALLRDLYHATSGAPIRRATGP